MSQFTEMTDYELVSLYEQGNDDAFDTILARHQSDLFAYILHTVQDQDTANDVFQETFTRAIMQIRNHQYQTSGKFSAWLMRIAHNIIIDNLRRNHLANTTEEQKEKLIYNNLTLSENATDDYFSQMSIKISLDALIDKLPENQRELLRLRFVEDLSFKEIADITGVSINTALGRMRYALINLRKQIGETNFLRVAQ